MEQIESFSEIVFAGIVILISLITSARKAKTKRIAEAAKQSRAREQASAETAQTWTPIQPTVLPPLVFAEVPGQVVAPTVHPHLEPDCAPHDAPGSLGVTTLEGKDPCHEEQLTHPRTADESAPDTSGLTFDWSGENLVKAFVMQEVLTRPCQRQAR